MDITIIKDYVVIPVFLICICIGYILKELVPTDKVNRFIPLFMGVLGVLLTSWINMSFNPTILLQGLASGLASTGGYEMVKNLLKKE